MIDKKIIEQLDPKLCFTLMEISRSNRVIRSVFEKSDTLESFCNNLIAAIIYEYDRDLKEKEKIKNMVQQVVNTPFLKR
jgi:hypothetical protein|tara:strand:- start:1234 stop:1470 length:237 start_codon:yes stop_codon:yes gene_type:complete